MKSRNAHWLWLIGFMGVISANLSYAHESSINGFMSIVAGKTTKDNETFVVDPQTGTHYDQDLSFKPESVYGIQLRTEISENLSSTAQLVGRGSTDFDIGLEWAYLTYEFNENWSLQAGRLRAPFFRYSSSLDVGYSYHWVRPPAVTYNLSTMNRFEGVGLNYSNYFGDDWDASVSALFGSARIQSSVGSSMFEFVIDNMVSLNAEASNEWVTFNAKYLKTGNKDSDVEQSDLESINVGICELLVGKAAYSVGAEANLGKIFVISEVATLVPNEPVVNGIDSWYMSLGARMGDFVPHITYGELKERDEFENGEILDYSTIAVGLQYFFNSQTSIKVEHLSRKDSSIEKTLVPGVASPGDANVLSMSVDLLF